MRANLFISTIFIDNVETSSYGRGQSSIALLLNGSLLQSELSCPHNINKGVTDVSIL